MRRPFAAAFVAAGLAAAGCASVHPVGAPVLLEHGDPRVAGWLERARLDGEARRTLRALGSLKVAARRGGGRVKQVILVERPARLRLESLDFLGQSRSVLVTDGRRYMFFDGQERRNGTLGPKTLLDLMGLDLDPLEAVRALLAAPGASDVPVTRVFARGEERIVEQGSRRLYFTAHGELAAFEVRTPSGEIRWRAEYRSWREVPGGRYPQTLHLSFPASELHAEIELREVELNAELDPLLFRVTFEEGL